MGKERQGMNRFLTEEVDNLTNTSNIFSDICNDEQLLQVKALAEYQYKWKIKNNQCYEPFVSMKHNGKDLPSPWRDFCEDIDDSSIRWPESHLNRKLTDKQAVKVYGKENIENFIKDAMHFFEKNTILMCDFDTLEVIWKQQDKKNERYYSYFDGDNGNTAYGTLKDMYDDNHITFINHKEKKCHRYFSNNLTDEELEYIKYIV